MDKPTAIMPHRFTARILSNRALTPTAYEMTLERGGLKYQAGQLLVVHGRHTLEERSYTICSGERDPHLQILYRVIPTGILTPWLAQLHAGETLTLSAPYGEFTIRDTKAHMIFIATGTGIAPARAFLRTQPKLDLTVIHGVRSAEDLFYREEFSAIRYAPCVSGASGTGWFSRVTDFCSQCDCPADAHYYLCGSNAMFYDARDILAAKGVPPGHIFTEAYYYQGDE